MRRRLHRGHDAPRRTDHRRLTWLAPVLVWLSVLAAGTLALGHYCLRSLRQGLDMAVRLNLDTSEPGDSAYPVFFHLALQTWIPMMRVLLLFALVVLIAHLAASGTSWLVEATIRRGCVSQGSR